MSHAVIAIIILTHVSGLNIFYLYTLYIEQHIKTYNNIQSSDLYESVSHLKYHFTHIIEIWRENHFCTKANFGTQMYYKSLETFQLYVI